MIFILLSHQTACFAITNEQAAQFGEDRGLIEAKLAGLLWAHTSERKAAHATNYLQYALGDRVFSAQISSNMDNTRQATFTTAGLRDQTSPYLRSQAAEIIAAFSVFEVHTVVLENAAIRETSPIAREEIYLACVKLKLKVCADAVARKAFVVQFLTDANLEQSYSHFRVPGLPQKAFIYILEYAEDNGIQEADWPIRNLHDGIFKEEALMQPRLEAALHILDLASKFQGIALYERAISSILPLVRAYALRNISKGDYPAAVYANALLVRLFLQADIRNPEVGKTALILKQILDNFRTGSQRAENINFSFEEGPDATGLPIGYSLDKTRDSTLCYPEVDLPAFSYNRCLGLSNLDPSVSLRLVSRPTPLVSSSKYPVNSIEFGVTYRQKYPEDDAVLIGEDGMWIVDKDGKSTLSRQQVKLTAVITFTDNTVIRQEEAKDNPCAFNNWEKLNGTFSSAKGIRLVQLELNVSGKGTFYFDDLYLRRGSAFYDRRAPAINSLTVSPQVVYLVSGEEGRSQSQAVSLKSGITAAEASSLAGYWASNLDGNLGSGRQLAARFSSVGQHNVFFLARDEFGLEDSEIVEVTVKECRISLGKTDLPGGNFRLQLNYGGDCPSPAALFKRYDLYMNQAPFQQNVVFPYILESKYILPGINTVQVKAITELSPELISTNTLLVEGSGIRIPNIVSPAYGQEVSGDLNLAVFFSDASAQGQAKAVHYFVTDGAGKSITLGSSTLAPDFRLFVSGLKLSSLSGSYNIYAIAVYPDAKGGTINVRSYPVNVFFTRSSK
jgi:hypothetical protein